MLNDPANENYFLDSLAGRVVQGSGLCAGGVPLMSQRYKFESHGGDDQIFALANLTILTLLGFFKCHIYKN